MCVKYQEQHSCPHIACNVRSDPCPCKKDTDELLAEGVAADDERILLNHSICDYYTRVEQVATGKKCDSCLADDAELAKVGLSYTEKFSG